MTPNVLRLVSRGKDHSGAMLPHLPKQWLRAPLTVEITCAADDDNATSLADVDSFTLMFRELNANRLPGDAPEGIVWYSEETPIAENLGKTKGPHARFELSAADVANITEAKDYWIAVHAVVGEDRILRAAGIIAFADDGFPAEAPTPTDPGDYYLTKAQADTLYAAIGEGGGPGATNISITQNNATSVTVNSDTGSDGTIVGATTTAAGVMTAAHVTSLGIKADLTGANFSGPVSVPNQITLVDTSSAFLINITGTAEDDDLTFVLPTSSGTIATQAYVTGITNGKVSKSGDTMTGMLTVPNITITNSATFGTVLAHNEISTVATAVRENQLPNADGVFALASNTEGVPDKLGTRAKCNVAAGVTKGNVVYLDGADGNNPTFALANASSEATSSKTYGFIDRACAVNGFGFIITNGLLDGLSIAASYAEPGDSVWLSTVSGGIEIGVPPAKPAHSVYLGIATKVSNSGQLGATIQTIEVKVQNGYELAELHDVNDQVTDSTAFLVKNAGTGVWESKNSADSRVSLGVPSVGDLDAQRVDIQTFGGPSTSGSFTWVKPANAKLVLVRIIGAGSGGASGICRATSVLRTGGGGGAGGAAAIQLIPAADLPATVAVTVGAGTVGGVGTNNTAANHANAVQGGASFFGSYRANGGGATNGTTAATGLSGSVFSLVAGAAAGNGGSGNTTGGAGANAAIQPSHFVGTGGGGGGSAAAGSVAGANGGTGGDRLATVIPLGYGVLLAGGVPGISGGSGSSGGTGNNQDQSIAAGTGGGGGAYATGANGGNGGQGGWPGGGGGGGGAADDGFTAGSGGRGGHGMVQVITYF